jgi:hypothetical protein
VFYWQRTECEGVSKISEHGKHWSSTGDKKKASLPRYIFRVLAAASFPLDGYKIELNLAVCYSLQSAHCTASKQRG